MTQFTTPTGRLVFGDSFKAAPVMDDTTKLQRVGKDGQPVWEFIVGVAFPKNDPGTLAMLATFNAADKAAWPQFFGADGKLLPGVKFADKITDGDGFSTKGESYAARDGWAGHWIVRFASRFAPKNWRWDGTRWVQVDDPAAIKPGYYVQISGATTSNQSTQSPGMYRNLDAVALIGFGTEIVRKDMDPAARFGNAPPPLPPGATATPQAPAAPVPGAVTPPPSTAHVAPPPAPAAPAPTPPPPPVVPAAPVRVMRDGSDYAAWVGAGWTDEQLIAAGHMAG